jgi:hypothetical protein
LHRSQDLQLNFIIQKKGKQTMSLKVWRFIVLILAALTVGMRFAHVLELPPKLAWEDAELYLTVQTSLYALFAIVGPIVDIGAVLSSFALAYMLRGRPAFRYTIAGAVSLTITLIVWLLIIAPATPHFAGVVPIDWMMWRSQWQFGQAGGFVLDVIGFCLLLVSVLQETSDK